MTLAFLHRAQVRSYRERGCTPLLGRLFFVGARLRAMLSLLQQRRRLRCPWFFGSVSAHDAFAVVAASSLAACHC